MFRKASSNISKSKWLDVLTTQTRSSNFFNRACSDASPESMEASAKAITDFLRRQQFKEVFTRFTDQMKEAMPADRLEASWMHVMMHLGPLRKHPGGAEGPRVRPGGRPLRVENGPMIVFESLSTLREKLPACGCCPPRRKRFADLMRDGLQPVWFAFAVFRGNSDRLVKPAGDALPERID